jgi:hypothetical protein
MAPVTAKVPERLRDERGMPGIGVSIWRRDRSVEVLHTGTVEEFLLRPENQSGRWLIDGGWGGPPGPLVVDWIDGEWVSRGWLASLRETP